MYGITPRNPITPVSYQAAFDIESIEEVDYQKTMIKEGLELFEQIHGYKAIVFVPTNGSFNNRLEKITATSGIKYLVASKIQFEPIGDGKFRKHFHYLGQKNKLGQTYLTRNCIFEPSSSLKANWVDSCMNDISIAFRWHKPAVISSHRVNYIGWINPLSRDGLTQLKELLQRIVKTWSDVEFMTAVELGNFLNRK